MTPSQKAKRLYADDVLPLDDARVPLELPKPAAARKKRPKSWRSNAWKFALLLAVAAGAYFYFRHGGDAVQQNAVVAVTRGPLEITVLEGGSVESQDSQEMKSEVQGQTKILSIVDEGYTITPDDVANKKVLVELDSKDLLDRQTEQELQYLNAVALHTQAKEQYDIQVNQNESDVIAADLAAKFARLDLEKYLGAKVVSEILARLHIVDSPTHAATLPPAPDAAAAVAESAAATPEKPAAAASSEKETLSDPPAGLPVPPAKLPTLLPNVDAAAPAAPATAAKAPREKPHSGIDFSKYADPAKLGDGEARQMIRKLDNDLLLAQKDVGLSQGQLEGTKRLYSKEFVTKTDLENDEMRLKRSDITEDAANVAKDLYIKYEFPKQSETFLSTYEESLRKLIRTQELALSKLAQAEGTLKSSEAQLALQTRKRNELRDQIAKCKMYAEKPGLVVYGSKQDGYRQEDRIEEGAIVRERQVIITIPDPARMAVKVKVHEAFVKRVKKGQKVRLRVDANPDVPLTGEVLKIGVLPDAQNRWMNPELKVYETSIAIDGNYDWLKPGMSAQAEIIIDKLNDVLQVPLQAVSPEGDDHVCYVSHLSGPERRVVEIGANNDSFIEIKSGLKEGEKVLLRAPQSQDDKNASPDETKPGEENNGKAEGAKPEKDHGDKVKGKSGEDHAPKA